MVGFVLEPMFNKIPNIVRLQFMAERKRVIGIAVAAALGVTFAALRYNKSFEQSAGHLRTQIVRSVASHINYSELAQNPDDLYSFRQQISGEWRVSSVVADILAEPNRDWQQVYGPSQSIAGPGLSLLQEFKPADQQLRGLYIFREHTEDPNRRSRFFRDMVQEGRVTNWLVGEKYLPKRFRPYRS